MMKYYSGMIDEGAWRHASGDIAVFNTKYRRDLKSLVVQLEPIQAGSGDPSPDNIRPISGWTGATIWRTGKNLYDLSEQTQNIRNTYLRTQLKPNTNYVFSVDSALTGMYIAYSDADEMPPDLPNSNWIDMVHKYDTSVLNFNSGVHKWYRIMTYEQDGMQDHTYQLELGATATPYVPYTGTAYPISWETEAGTVYGGAVDVVSGKLTVDSVQIDLSTLSWTAITNSRKTYFRSTSEFTQMLPSTGNTIIQPILCNKYMPETWSHTVDATGFDKTITIGWINRSFIAIYDSDYTDAASFINSLPGTQFVYMLATPQTYQLTPQEIRALIGENVIWSDAGAVTVEYWG